jgi:hypothetical protein
MDKDVIVKYVSRCLEGVKLLYEWALYRLTLRVGYKIPLLSETDNNLFAVFKAIIDEFSPKEEKLNQTYPEKAHIFFKNEMHDVLHYDGGLTVEIAPSPRHNTVLYIPEDICRFYM